jgi:Zn-dependent protease
VVIAKLTEAANTGDSSGLDFFNDRVFDVLLPVFVIQTFHELGHRVVAWRDNLKISLPTLLPFWQLPFLGAQTQIKESPKNLTSLFDFAVAGSVLGLATSEVFLLIGLQATAAVDA